MYHYIIESHLSFKCCLDSILWISHNSLLHSSASSSFPSVIHLAHTLKHWPPTKCWLHDHHNHLTQDSQCITDHITFLGSCLNEICFVPLYLCLCCFFPLPWQADVSLPFKDQLKYLLLFENCFVGLPCPQVKELYFFPSLGSQNQHRAQHTVGLPVCWMARCGSVWWLTGKDKMPPHGCSLWD